MWGDDTDEQNTDNEILLLEMCNFQNQEYMADCFVYMWTIM